MNWNKLSDLESLVFPADKRFVLFFKHSPRCPISGAALRRIEKKWQSENNAYLRPYLIHVLKERSLSDALAERYAVTHASPQLLLIDSTNKCVYDASHEGISYEALMKACAQVP